jgi:hypothetical protein
MCVNLEANEKLPCDQSESQTDHDADYPCWKIGAKNIYRGRVGIRSATRQQQIARQENGIESQVVHYWWWLDCGDGDGFARSPTLKARAAAPV